MCAACLLPLSADGFAVSTWRLHNGPSGALCQGCLNLGLLQAGELVCSGP